MFAECLPCIIKLLFLLRIQPGNQILGCLPMLGGGSGRLCNCCRLKQKQIHCNKKHQSGGDSSHRNSPSKQGRDHIDHNNSKSEDQFTIIAEEA